MTGSRREFRKKEKKPLPQKNPTMVNSCPIGIQIITVGGMTIITENRKKGREKRGI